MFAYISQIGVPAAQLGEPLVYGGLSAIVSLPYQFGKSLFFYLSDRTALSFVLLSTLKRS